METKKLSKQPKFNIAMVGSVTAGKSSIIRALTGVETFKHSKEKERGMTMKIGYTNCKIFKCDTCPEPECYQPSNSKVVIHKCLICQKECKLTIFFSFLDCPGHDSLMNTMLSGATLMDFAILLIDGSQKCPQPQTIEHLAALEILNVKKIIILQNKLDIVDTIKAKEQYDEIKKFVAGSCAQDAPIIPVSAHQGYNLDVLCEFIIKHFNDIKNNSNSDRPIMNIIRSFDVNKPGTDISELKGGVIGGSLVSGQLHVGSVIEIRPGLVNKDHLGKISWTPIQTEITSIQTDSDVLETADSGGLISLCTNIDPILTRSDNMVGQVIGLPGLMPEVYLEICAECFFMKRNGISDIKTIRPHTGDILLLNIASKSVIAQVKIHKKNLYTLTLQQPCCVGSKEKFSISSKIGNAWKLIGMGIVSNI